MMYTKPRRSIKHLDDVMLDLATRSNKKSDALNSKSDNDDDTDTYKCVYKMKFIPVKNTSTVCFA